MPTSRHGRSWTSGVAWAACCFPSRSAVSARWASTSRSRCWRRSTSTAGAADCPNVHLARSDGDDLSSLETFDLVHSFIVFQHISPARGEATLRELGRVLNRGGVGVLHFAYALKLRPWWLRDVIGALRTRALRLFGPIVEMYPYDLNRVFATLHEGGIARLHVELTDHDYYGTILFFQR